MRNRRAEVRYAKIWIEGKWWSWNEERERLVDGSGIEWGEKGKKEVGRSKEVVKGEGTREKEIK